MAGDKIKIAVIGGGIQGLAVAYFLSQDSKYQVTLLERNPKLGGLLGLIEVNGVSLEGAYHHWFNYDTAIIELVKELGLAGKLLYLKSKMSLFYGNKIYPFGTPWDLLKFSPLSLWQRLRVGLAVLFLRNYKDYKKFEHYRAVDWLKKYMGEQAYKILWEPLLRGKFGDYKDDITMTWMWSRLSGRVKTRTTGGKEELVYPRGGFKQIIDVLAEKIIQQGGEIFLNTDVKEIDSLVDGKTKITIFAQELTFDKAVVTTPISVFLKLAKNLPEEYVKRCAQIKYRGAHVVVLVLKQSLMPQGYYWLNINETDMPLLVVLEHTNLLPKQDYGCKTIVYLGNYPDPQDPIMTFTDEEVIKKYCQYLPRINKNFERDWIEQYFVFKDKTAQPVVDFKYKDLIPSCETPLKNVYLVTMAQIYPDDRGTSNAVKQAQEFVKKI